MLRQQRWIPDTCANPSTGDACSLIEEWDDESDLISRSHKFVRREKACSLHSKLNDRDGFDTCYNENRRKNTTFNILKNIDPQFSIESFEWKYDEKGILLINVGGRFDQTKKQLLQNTCDIQFGLNKVVIN